MELCTLTEAKGMNTIMIEYLFIRLLEACNSGCFMCSYADSDSTFRLREEDFLKLVDAANEEGVKYVRFTGGEPLLDKNLGKFISVLTYNKIKSSIITNGMLLEKKSEELYEAGLGQVIVSIDGIELTHDKARNRVGLYKQAIKGLQIAKRLGIHTRINTVCGPHNFRDMPELQHILTSMGIEQWELSSLKMGKKLSYTKRDIEEIQGIVERIYKIGARTEQLVPYGKIWCGGTEAEQERYFATGITPRPDKQCNVVEKVRYYDAKTGRMFACSLMPHRRAEESFFKTFEKIEDIKIGDDLNGCVEYFKENGSRTCTGCSTTAALFSNRLEAGEHMEDWAY